MSRLPRRSQRRFLTIPISLVVAGSIAFVIATRWIGATHPFEDPQNSPFRNSRSLDHLAEAQAQFAQGHYQASRAAARAALELAPLSQPALSTIALSYEAEGDAGKAAKGMSLAAGLGWRDFATQLWLSSAFSQNAKQDDAAQRLDAAFRTHDDSIEDLRQIAIFAANLGVSRALAARAAQRPRWRAMLLQDTGGQTPDLLHFKADLLAGLAAAGQPANPSEIRLVSMQLLSSGDIDRSRDLWLSGQKDRDRIIYDGDFRQADINNHLPYDWVFPKTLGIDLTLPDDEDEQSHGLTISADGPVSEHIAKQVTFMRPGSYRLSYTASPPSPSSPLQWKISCPESRTDILQATADGKAAEFVVPAGGCRMQMVELFIQPRAFQTLRETSIYGINIARLDRPAHGVR